MTTDTIDKFFLENFISLFGITGTFVIIMIGIIAYLSFKIGKKQVPDSYNTNKVQCIDYTNEMEKKGFPYQYLEMTYCNSKPLNTNCPYWKSKKVCEINSQNKCKFFV
jgi:hypothetical protein